MSGGHFDYEQYKITMIVDSIQHEIDNSGRKLSENELSENYGWRGDSDWFEKYPEDKYYIKYPEDVLNEFKLAVKTLKRAEIYAQRVDWLLSGDDGDESFLRRLKDELNKLEDD